MTSTPVNSSLTDNLYLNQALSLALEQLELHLKDFVNSEEFVAKMRLAFGETFDLEAALNLGNAWKNQDFSNIPAITILSSAELNGANGAYAAATNTIYLSQEFVTNHQEDVVTITSVILEEIGHWVDSQINTADSLGDEGAIFSALVQGESLSEEVLRTLKLEDDRAIITLNGQAISIEQQNFTGDAGNNNITGTIGDDLIEGLGGNDTLNGEAGNDTIDGGIGNDTLNGGTGNNIYLFGKGDGQDIINPYSDSTAGKLNTLQFKAGVLPSEVIVKQVYDNYWGYQALQLSIAGTTDSVKVIGFFYGYDPNNIYNPLQQVTFADGTVWNLATLVAKALTSTDGDDSIIGTNADETLSGGLGNDNISGVGGNDILNGNEGNDNLSGGDGNDILSGNEGNDSIKRMFEKWYSVIFITLLPPFPLVKGGNNKNPVLSPCKGGKQ
jgi:hypothetical protein